MTNIIQIKYIFRFYKKIVRQGHKWSHCVKGKNLLGKVSNIQRAISTPVIKYRLRDFSRANQNNSSLKWRRVAAPTLEVIKEILLCYSSIHTSEIRNLCLMKWPCEIPNILGDTKPHEIFSFLIFHQA